MNDWIGRAECGSCSGRGDIVELRELRYPGHLVYAETAEWADATLGQRRASSNYILLPPVGNLGPPNHVLGSL